MNIIRIGAVIPLMVFATVSCSVVSREAKKESVPFPSFKALALEADAYAGKTVILGGYIIATRFEGEETIIEVLQAPLGLMDEPKSRDLSEGRFSVLYTGFLDPTVYRKDRKLTVAGTLTTCTIDRIPICNVKSREIHLWSDYDYRRAYNYYPPGPPVFYPPPRRRYYYRYREPR